MAYLVTFGIAAIIAFQALGTWLVGPMKCFSFLGSEGFFTLFVPLVYWCVDAALGLRLAFMLLLGTSLNELIKLPLHGPRPYWVSTSVQALGSETSFGVPSGHSQISAGFWGVAAAYVNRAWVWAAALSLVALIGLSRLYLGVHFPHDVLVGWTLGFLTLWSFAKLWNPTAALVKAMSMGKQIGLAFSVSMGLLLLGALLAFLSHGWTPPADWIANATRSGGAAPDPLSLSTLIAASGTLFGQCIGLAWMTRRCDFSASGPVGKRTLRFFIGLVGIAVINLGLKAVLPHGAALLPTICRYARYVVLGFWVTGGAIWVFTKLQLTDIATEPSKRE